MAQAKNPIAPAEIIQEFPFPMAHLWEHLVSISPEDSESRCERPQEIVGFALRYCAIVLSSQSTQAERVRRDSVDRHLSITTLSVCAAHSQLTRREVEQYVLSLSRTDRHQASRRV